MLVSAIAALCREQITVEPFSSQDAYGNAAYKTPVTYRARVQQRARQITLASGAIVASQTQVYLVDPDVVIGIQDRITLPATYAPTQPPILAVRRSPDAVGARYVTVFC